MAWRNGSIVGDLDPVVVAGRVHLVIRCRVLQEEHAPWKEVASRAEFLTGSEAGIVGFLWVQSRSPTRKEHWSYLRPALDPYGAFPTTP